MSLPGISSKGQPGRTDRPANEHSRVSLPAVSGTGAAGSGPAGPSSASKPGSRVTTTKLQSDGKKKPDSRRGGPGDRRAARGKSREKSARSDTHGGGPHIRADSRVGRLLAEFGGKDDWVSMTIMRHQMAVVIQSCARGFLVRQRWREDPLFVVDELHRRIERERQAKVRREEAKKRLEQKLLTQKQKSKATNVLSKLFGKKAAGGLGGKPSPGKLGGKWGKLASNVDLALDAAELEGSAGGDGGRASDEDSDFSDLELEDIAAVKLRSRTPPWQKVEQSQWVGQYNKLNHRVNRGNVDVLWDTDECAGRLVDVKARRMRRGPAHSGDGAGDDGVSGEASSASFDPTTQELPATLIKELLASKYAEKWERLGLADYSPVRYGRLDEGLDEGPMKLTAVRLGPDDAQ